MIPFSYKILLDTVNYEATCYSDTHSKRKGNGRYFTGLSFSVQLRVTVKVVSLSRRQKVKLESTYAIKYTCNSPF